MDDARENPEEHRYTTHRDDDTGKLVGSGVGGLGGAVVGSAAGALAGPVGMIIGGIAGAAGGWWAGEQTAEVVEEMSARDEARFREHFESHERGVPRFEDARVGYLVGSVASRHPEYDDRGFEDIENHLRRGFPAPDEDWAYSYDELRPYLRKGYTHTRSRTP